jgi:hypothetical protein
MKKSLSKRIDRKNFPGFRLGMLFVNKKKQKTLINFVRGRLDGVCQTAPSQCEKSFLVLRIPMTELSEV